MTRLLILLICASFWLAGCQERRALVFQSDFGLKDGAVAAMKGVAHSVAPHVTVVDLTHEIPPFNILEAAYRLEQTAKYWPQGTVFVSIVDPGVGSTRKSIVMKSGAGQYFVSPDNGTLTLVAQSQGIAEVREIDESRNRLPGSESSYTFHGRDVYAYTGARLAGGIISFDETGPVLEGEIVRLPIGIPQVSGDTVTGFIPVLDVQFGNVWTNIDQMVLAQMQITHGDLVDVRIFRNQLPVFNGTLPIVHTFADVEAGKPLCYLNSMSCLSLGVNQGSFAKAYNVSSGEQWIIKVTKK